MGIFWALWLAFKGFGDRSLFWCVHYGSREGSFRVPIRVWVNHKDHQGSTWTPKVCRIIAFHRFWAIILPTFRGLGRGSFKESALPDPLATRKPLCFALRGLQCIKVCKLPGCLGLVACFVGLKVLGSDRPQVLTEHAPEQQVPTFNSARTPEALREAFVRNPKVVGENLEHGDRDNQCSFIRV